MRDTLALKSVLEYEPTLVTYNLYPLNLHVNGITTRVMASSDTQIAIYNCTFIVVQKRSRFLSVDHGSCAPHIRGSQS